MKKEYTKDEKDYGLPQSIIDKTFLGVYIKNQYLIKEHYMYDTNDNGVNLIRHGIEKAIAMLDSLENCEYCEDCIRCKNCINCFSCVNCENLENKMDIVINNIATPNKPKPTKTDKITEPFVLNDIEIPF